MDHGVHYCLLALLPLVYFLLKSLCKKAPLGSGSRHGLELPPGPWQLPVVGSIHHLCGSLVHRPLRDLSLRHGPLMFVRFGEVPVIVASTPDAAKEVMKTHDAIFSTRPLSFAMKTVTKDRLGIVRAPYGEHWRQLRKICTMGLPARRRRSGWRFKVKDRETLLRYLDECVRLAGGFRPRDLFPSSWLARALSRRAVREVQAYYHSLFSFMDGVLGEHLERQSSREEEDEKRDGHQKDLIDVLLRIQKEGNLQFPLTTRIIEAVIFDLIGGAIETATTTLQWAMTELMRNPV
ncbi:unnamed protein product [Miscanthus lutarioriparius]|uniref:Uncharacterized protein n=1 Tax=Miscanthus lutarioriparius TaxID=422564 RepID=A0A811RCN4_9POAL|nr:unnamed protein product [Miscanthus lutarioriparius]